MHPRRQSLLYVVAGIASCLHWGPAALGQTTASTALVESAADKLQRLRAFLGNPRLVGQHKFTYWGFAVYQASLWATPTAFQPEAWRTQRLALELRYLRDFSGRDIALRSLQEIQAQSAVAPEVYQTWLTTLQNLFPNVRSGDTLTGVYLPDQEARFFHDNKPIGVLQDRELAHRFFSIWLSPQTSEPLLRQKLLAGAAS